MPQLTYNIDHNVATRGLLADSAFKHVQSMIGTEEIMVGKGVVKVVGKDDQVQLPDATDNTLFGVAMFTQSLEGDLPGVDEYPSYPANDVVNVLRRGSIWVYCETAFDPDTDDLYLRHTTNGALVPGDFRNDADTANAVQITGNFQVRNTLSAAGLLLVELNKPA